MLHGKKYISIENIEDVGQEIAKEKEADDFAVSWILREQEEEEIMNGISLTPSEIQSFAKKFGTHPAIIIGRFQYKGIITL